MSDPHGVSEPHDDLYGTYGHAIMHPDPLIREKARRYVDGQLPDLLPVVDEVREVQGDGEHDAS